MSMNVNEIEETLQQLQHELAFERLHHIASILEYRYGIETNPFFANDKFGILMGNPDDDEFTDGYTYDTDQLLEPCVQAEALRLRTFFVMRNT